MPSIVSAYIRDHEVHTRYIESDSECAGAAARERERSRLFPAHLSLPGCSGADLTFHSDLVSLSTSIPAPPSIPLPAVSPAQRAIKIPCRVCIAFVDSIGRAAEQTGADVELTESAISEVFEASVFRGNNNVPANGPRGGGGRGHKLKQKK
ncbi:hypothetical protein EVAR_58258_1 [Eumeta japonica]|uniref:Uncharacterized protein n=1 Tax=Eumeta variegata TaxID=151549 RepID=A0A4C1ZC13_EUMVA|nr:hypothetical protein EVAR_58258_1 [Eumeta japonica]